jgi:hypothetical protein
VIDLLPLPLPSPTLGSPSKCPRGVVGAARPGLPNARANSFALAPVVEPFSARCRCDRPCFLNTRVNRLSRLTTNITHPPTHMQPNSGTTSVGFKQWWGRGWGWAVVVVVERTAEARHTPATPRLVRAPNDNNEPTRARCLRHTHLHSTSHKKCRALGGANGDNRHATDTARQRTNTTHTVTHTMQRIQTHGYEKYETGQGAHESPLLHAKHTPATH